MNGTCDVNGCTQPTFMGWRPLTEPRGRQICEYHWRRHLDPEDSFDLFEVFGFRRPAGIRKPVVKEYVPPCGCGLALSLHEPANTHHCRQCGGRRKPGHTYCDKCSRERKRHTHQERQRRYRQRQAQAVHA